MTAEGEILRPLDEAATKADLASAFAEGFRSIAIVFIHGYRFTAHERRVAELAREIGFSQISVSHEVSPLIKLIGRGDCTVADAYLSPVLDSYVEGLRAALGEDVPLFFMQSTGGLADGRAFRGKDAVLSGPAGGVVGMAKTAAEAGFERVVGLHMGGPSTDVTHNAGAFERTHETVVAGNRMRTPMLSIHTIAAGGGSICRFDGMRLRVGPQSAGAIPGPACYRRGGPLTVTDCNLMLGKLQPSFFPPIFGPSGDQPLDDAIVAEKFAGLAAEVGAATGKPASPQEMAEGFLTIAVESMAKAIRQVSIERGHDVTFYTLNCFGGAAGQHACLVADSLGIGCVMIHPLAGVLSAYGIGVADMRNVRERTIDLPLDKALGTMSQAVAALAADARNALLAQGVPLERIETFATTEIRYEGVDAALTVPYGSGADMRAAFEDQHKRRFGFILKNKTLVIETLSLEAIGVSASRAPQAPVPGFSGGPMESRVRARMAGAGQGTPLYARGARSLCA